MGALTTFPLCNSSLEFPEILSQNHKYAIVDWVCLGIVKWCIALYPLICPMLQQGCGKVDFRNIYQKIVQYLLLKNILQGLVFL